MPDKIDVVVGILQNKQQEILIAKRLSHKPLGNLWEFPGGKVEKNETTFEALHRELHEEVGIKVVNAQPFFEKSHDYGENIIKLHIFKITEYEGEPYSKEGQETRWIKLHELKNFSFPPANYDIINLLFCD